MTPSIVLPKVSRLLLFLAPIMVLGAAGPHAYRYESMERQGAAARLSVERCRITLGPAGAGLADADVIQLRDQLYGFAAVVLEAMPGPAFFPEDLEERAAIREYDGGAPRDDAESLTVIDFVTRRPF